MCRVAEAVSAGPPEDTSPLGRNELYVYLADKSQIRADGGVYYAASGKLEIVQKNERFKGSWSTHDDGSVCWEVLAWDERYCETYVRSGDTIGVMVDDALTNASPLQDGNTLDSLVSGSGRFSREETRVFLSGKTVIWGPARGLYYGLDFKLEKIWDGVRGTGTWSITDEGAVCWHIPGWGPTPCESYYYQGDELAVVVDGRHGKAFEHVEGNQIGSF